MIWCAAGSSQEEEYVVGGIPGVIPVGRGSHMMTMPTT